MSDFGVQLDIHIYVSIQFIFTHRKPMIIGPLPYAAFRGEMDSFASKITNAFMKTPHSDTYIYTFVYTYIYIFSNSYSHTFGEQAKQ